MTAVAAAISAGVGGSECRQRSFSRTDPMSRETDAADEESSVEPPPMSHTT
jgi:hypothetical protein